MDTDAPLITLTRHVQSDVTTRGLGWAMRNVDAWSAIRLSYGLGGLLMQCRDLSAMLTYVLEFLALASV
jgi:hypothetical protein